MTTTKSAGGHLRRTRRAVLALPALVKSSGRQQRACVRDLSWQGAMIETPANLRPGAPVRLSCGTIEADAVVVWGKIPLWGLRFLKPLEDAQILNQLHRARAVVARAAQKKQLRSQANSASPAAE